MPHWEFQASLEWPDCSYPVGHNALAFTSGVEQLGGYRKSHTGRLYSNSSPVYQSGCHFREKKMHKDSGH